MTTALRGDVGHFRARVSCCQVSVWGMNFAKFRASDLEKGLSLKFRNLFALTSGANCLRLSLCRQALAGARDVRVSSRRETARRASLGKTGLGFFFFFSQLAFVCLAFFLFFFLFLFEFASSFHSSGCGAVLAAVPTRARVGVRGTRTIPKSCAEKMGRDSRKPHLSRSRRHLPRGLLGHLRIAL